MGITPKICHKHPIPYHHPVNEWLPGAAYGNQRQTMMDLLSSMTTIHKNGYNTKYALKFKLLSMTC